MSNEIKNHAMPRHIGIIMDGNRSEGYYAGERTLKLICTECKNLGIKYLTVFKVNAVNHMEQLQHILINKKEFIEDNVCVKIVGAIENLNKSELNAIEEIERDTAECDGITLTIVLNYDGKEEILNALNKVLDKVNSCELDNKPVTKEIIEKHMYTEAIPEPEMIIRTGGEQRTSGFLLWKASYSELVFVDKLWLDFKKEDLHSCISEFQSRTINRGQ